MALLPVLAWEFLLKPARVRRNVALALIAEIDLNLIWLLRLMAKRTTDRTGISVNPRARTLVLTATAPVMAELPPEAIAELLRFYSGVEDIVAAIEKLHLLGVEHTTALEDRKRDLALSMGRGQGSLDNNLPATVRRGHEIRARLYKCAEAVSFLEVPPLLPIDEIVDEAVQSDAARRQSEGGPTGTG